MNPHGHDHTPAPDDGEAMPRYYEIMETSVRELLGLPPDWYKLKPYRARAVTEPRAVLAEFGTIIPDDVEIRVSDSTAMVRYLVLPRRPPHTENFSEEQLASLVTRDAMIGVVRANTPQQKEKSR